MHRHLSLALITLLSVGVAPAAESAPASPAVAITVPAHQPATLPTKAQVEALIDLGQAFLLSKAQADGSFMPGDKFKLGITQLAAEALAQPPKALAKDHPVMAKALAFQAGNIQPDGGIYGQEGNANYCTSLALMLWTATRSGEPQQIAGAQQFLFGIQNAETSSINAGGIGYGSKGKGHEDLSNTSYAIAALRGSGIPASDPHLQAALGFLMRCQDLSAVPFDGNGAASNGLGVASNAPGSATTAINPLPWVKNSGGGVYAPDESKAGGSWAKGEDATAKLDPYGSMSYALISSYLALDLVPSDPRVAAALGWAKRNYRFDANPGMATGLDKNGQDKTQQGLFYYYVVLAKTYDLIDQGPMYLDDGRSVDWRADLFQAIEQRAKPDAASGGRFWSNDQDRWGEGLPQLTTAYAVRALKRIHGSL